MKIRLLNILLTITFLTSISYGQTLTPTISDSSFALYHAEFSKNNSPIDFPLIPVGWTNDYEHILTKSQVYVLDSIISSFERQTTIEIALVTIDSSFVKPEEFDNMITTIGRIWGVGKDDKNNGLIIGISSNLRKIRISNGYGIEKVLTDFETKKIIDDVIVPEFKNANFYDGIKKGLIAIIAKLT